MNDEGLTEMQEVLMTKLGQNGVLKKIKAQVRAEIFKAMMIESGSSSSNKGQEKKRSENVVVNEIVKEYLSFNGYMQTLSVFTTEAGLNKKRPFGADFVAQEVGLSQDDGVDAETRKLPMIYQMIESLKTKRFEDKVGLYLQNDDEEEEEEENYENDLPRVRMLDSIPPPRSPGVTNSRQNSPLSLRPPFH